MGSKTIKNVELGRIERENKKTKVIVVELLLAFVFFVGAGLLRQ